VFFSKKSQANLSDRTLIFQLRTCYSRHRKRTWTSEYSSLQTAL